MCSVMLRIPFGPNTFSGSFSSSTQGVKIRSANPAVWSVCRWVQKALVRRSGRRASMPR